MVGTPRGELAALDLWCGGDEVAAGGSEVVMAVGGLVDRIDRKVGIVFGFAGKSPGGGRRWRWQPAAAGELRKKFKKAEKERDDLKLTLEKYQTSSKNLSKLLESQVNDKTGLGYDSQVFDSQVFDCENLHSYESDDSVPTSRVNDRYKTGEGYHVVPPPYTGTFMPPEPNLVFNDAPNASKSVANLVSVESSSNKPSKDMSKTLRPDAPIIEDWTSDSEDVTKIESLPKQKEPSFVPTSEHVKTPRENLRTNKLKTLGQTINQKSRSQKNSWTRKACFVCKSLNHFVKDCDFYKKQTVQKPLWNHAMRVNR
nr:hypothetical protein [Tanacetum cinerariifolium]